MNKVEKLISLVIGGVLVWYVFFYMPKAQQERNAAAAAQASTALTNAVPSQVKSVKSERKIESAAVKPAVGGQAEKKPSQPEQIVVLENDELKLEFSSWGGVLKKAVLKKYPKFRGEVSKDNPAVEFDFASSPLGRIQFSDTTDIIAYGIKEKTDDKIVFESSAGVREVTLGKNYLVSYVDTLSPAKSSSAKKVMLSLGKMAIGDEKDDVLSIDSWAQVGDKVIHHCEGDSPFKGYLAGGAAGGCSGSSNAAGRPKSSGEIPYAGPQKWVALKNRFFVTALASVSSADGKTPVVIDGFSAEIQRDMNSSSYRPKEVQAKVSLNLSSPVKSVFYVGPKKQSLLMDLGMKDVMEFGMWRVICYPLVWILNFFYSFIPNYGVAIILLTILVRLIFWPLNHKSTVGMKKMQEVQPLMKEIQTKFKDNPQRMQQEMMALYRDQKINPLSSCLPMLAQIPVFIALFNVLRSAVELRYASFLWISDLSAPEGLGAGSWFPWFGGLNILPILMAVTMGLQSALTPGGGDPRQKRMMTVMMPVMMLFMFYNFASALSLYWTLSQVVSIIQMWVIRRSASKNSDASSAVDVTDAPITRQMRRHQV
jgi:YidC/Oxa1 family membrane protein insertase